MSEPEQDASASRYVQLTERDMVRIGMQRLAELEAEHFRQTLLAEECVAVKDPAGAARCTQQIAEVERRMDFHRARLPTNG